MISWKETTRIKYHPNDDDHDHHLQDQDLIIIMLIMEGAPGSISSPTKTRCIPGGIFLEKACGSQHCQSQSNRNILKERKGTNKVTKGTNKVTKVTKDPTRKTCWGGPSSAVLLDHSSQTWRNWSDIQSKQCITEKNAHNSPKTHLLPATIVQRMLITGIPNTLDNSSWILLLEMLV